MALLDSALYSFDVCVFLFFFLFCFVEWEVHLVSLVALVF